MDLFCGGKWEMAWKANVYEFLKCGKAILTPAYLECCADKSYQTRPEMLSLEMFAFKLGLTLASKNLDFAEPMLSFWECGIVGFAGYLCD